MSAQRTVSIQEAVHMVDNQDLVICSEKFTYLSIRQGAMLTNNKDSKKKKDIVTMYRNCSKQFEHFSMDEYSYKHFCQDIRKEKGDGTEATKNRILLPVGQNCKPRYPVTYEYAKRGSHPVQTMVQRQTTYQYSQKQNSNNPYIQAYD